MSTSASELHSAFGRAGRHVMVALDGIRFSDPDAAATQPPVWVDAFRVAIAQGRQVSHDARTCIQENLQRCTADDFVASELDRKALLDLLSPRPGVSARLLEMAECGLLECVFPELQQIHRRAAPDPHRHHIQLLKRAVDKGRFGRIYLANTTVRWNRPQDYYDSAPWRGTWEFDGGAFMNQASHYVDLIQWIVGPVESVIAKTATLARRIEAEDSGVAVLRFRNGAIGVIEVNVLTYPRNWKARSPSSASTARRRSAARP